MSLLSGDIADDDGFDKDTCIDYDFLLFLIGLSVRDCYSNSNKQIPKKNRILLNIESKNDFFSFVVYVFF